MMHHAGTVFLKVPAIIIIIALVMVLMMSAAATGAELRLYVAAGMRQPVDRLVEDFQKKTGRRVVVDYDGSGRLVAKISLSGLGDVFMPGGLIYVQQLESKGKIKSWKPVIAYTPVVAVNKSKRDEIASLYDLAKPGLKLALGDSKAMAYGKIAQTILERAAIAQQVQSNVVVYGATVKQLVLYVMRGDVDASIVGRADAFQFRDSIEMIDIPRQYYDEEFAPVAVLSSTRDKKAATELQQFLASEEAINVFESFGFLRLE